MMFFELYCDKQQDLLGASVDDESGPKKVDFEIALGMLDGALKKRAKSKTANNATSSRSHAIVKIVNTKLFLLNDAASEPVVFTIVDLAGKESLDELNLKLCSEDEETKLKNECHFINLDLEGISKFMNDIKDHKGSNDPFQVEQYYRTKGALVRILKDSLKSSVVLYLFTMALDSPKSKYTIGYVFL